ncbi:MAG: hypothetical protein Q8O19_02260 [Rectinemataceae bacterium]|nr:hypothetical protein [Rectinemataceae bacterium]
MKKISFVTRVREGWSKERLMAQYGLTEAEYRKTLEDIKRIEAKEGRTLPEPQSEDQSFPIIQVYSPGMWHDEQAILMNEAGRKKLIEALQSGAKKIVLTPFVNDGEGFYLYVQILPEPEIEKFKSPYTDETCRNIEGESEKIDPKYPVTPDQHKLIEQGKDAGEWKVIL